ncbi:serine carboxypeptidase-like 45 isoform X2 [Quercus suber]|uniref:serine carboxypeptidase-like 45 isoform X2 n=1 Tax=Quercus suber TaxID=58331 RepID=UPI0032DEF24E
MFCSTSSQVMQSQPWIVMVIICTSLLQIFLPAVESDPSIGDIVLSLPGQPVFSFQQYAGNVTVNSNSSQPQRTLFYYFVEAEAQPASKPVVLWLNGGPGCSSLGLGAFFTHGPFKPSGSGTLIKNDYSWNKEAHMLYVESPAGVGFSYYENKTFYANVTDDMHKTISYFYDNGYSNFHNTRIQVYILQERAMLVRSYF